MELELGGGRVSFTTRKYQHSHASAIGKHVTQVEGHNIHIQIQTTKHTRTEPRAFQHDASFVLLITKEFSENTSVLVTKDALTLIAKFEYLY